MISFLKGKLAGVTTESVIIDVNGFGMEVNAPANVIDRMPQVGSDIELFTYLSVKEDAMTLYGFAEKDDLNLFKLLITVNGIGPKAALSIISTIPADTLRFAILADDAKTLSRAPGIGLKTAKKIVLELKDKAGLSADDINDITGNGTTIEPDAGSDPKLAQVRADAVEALTALGYPAAEAMKAVRSVAKPGMGSDDILKASLKML